MLFNAALVILFVLAHIAAFRFALSEFADASKADDPQLEAALLDFYRP